MKADDKFDIELTSTPKIVSPLYKENFGENLKTEPIDLPFIYENAPIYPKFCCFNKLVDWKNMPDRKILTNVPDLALPNNKISTSKYSLMTFIPKNLLEQFSKMANMYFLIIGFLQIIKEISTSAGVPVTLFPLSFIMIISALKDLFEDLKRHKSDNEENHRKTKVLKDGEFKEIIWEQLNVGDIISLNQDEYFPADTLILKSSERKGVCFIETKNLDGETNLKQKKAHPELDGLKEQKNNAEVNINFIYSHNYKNNFKLFSLKALFIYEKPNPYLYTFNGHSFLKLNILDQD